MRGVDGFLICVCVREERQEENREREGERERGLSSGLTGLLTKHTEGVF